MNNGLWALQIWAGQMKNIHLEMKESVYFSGNVALASLKSSDNIKWTKPSFAENWELFIFPAQSWNIKPQ